MSCPFHRAPAEPDSASGNGANQAALSIPGPSPSYFTGNVKDIDPSFLIRSFWNLADIYGPIFKLTLPGRSVVVVSNYEFINEVCNEERFEKFVAGPLNEVRALTGDGLFTAHQHEPNWGKAHRMLMPAFGPLAIRKMFPQMLDIASQMILRWDRLGPENQIDPSDDFTRLAFDTIGICAFNYRFNDFYLDRPHQFASQMAEVLIESGKRAGRPQIENYVRIWSNAHNQENVAMMHKLCDDLVAERKRNPKPEVNDLLNVMLNAKDPQTGEGLSDENIRYQMVTFLVAGHETTSGTLSYVFYHLLRNPDKLMAAQKEVDEVLGDNALEEKHIPQLKYVEACIREALRFQGPIGQISVHAKAPTRIAGKYEVTPDVNIVCNFRGLHHDPKVWGDDADVFKPERMLDGKWEKLPRNAWKPFGNGARACIGRGFAEQEMIMNIALILQRFQIVMADPSYDLQLKSTLTVKPFGFRIKAIRRPGKSHMVGIPGAPKAGAASAPTQSKTNGASVETAKSASGKKPIHVIYGSNAGTCKSFAEEIQSSAGQHGFEAEVQTMDSAVEQLPKDRPVVVITPSYEGKPADNAKKFVSWLETNADSSALKGVNFSVFGVGNAEWYSTFHRIPKLVDELMEKMGATRFVPMGLCNVNDDILGPWEDWLEKLWSSLRSEIGVGEVKREEMKVAVLRPEQVDLLAGSEASLATVKVNRQIAGAEVGSAKRHMEVELPVGTTYRTGDYLVVLPFNMAPIINRVQTRFGLHSDDRVSIEGTSKAFLKSTAPISIFELLATRVELSTPASQRQIKTLIEATPDASQAAKLEHLASEAAYKTETLTKRYSILDLLEEAPSCRLTLSSYLDMLKPLTPRQYSISSSPLTTRSNGNSDDTPVIASITYDVHEAPAYNGHGTFHGVASSYLANRTEGSKIRCFVRPTNAGFHLPPDPETPVIMIAAGTGLAPMRGFIQSRACLKAAGARKLGPAILYFGCRDVDKDYIYKDELQRWEKEGVVSLRPAFSKHGPEGAPKYVYERIWEDREELATLFKDHKAKIFVCGSAAKLARSASETVQKIWMEKHPGKSEAEATEWLQEIKETRYVSDVFD